MAVEKLLQQRRAGLAVADDENRPLIERRQRPLDRLGYLAQPGSDLVDGREQVAPRRLDPPRVVARTDLKQRVDPPVEVVQAHRLTLLALP